MMAVKVLGRTNITFSDLIRAGYHYTQRTNAARRNVSQLDYRYGHRYPQQSSDELNAEPND
jgi:hypothetical protein